MTEIPLGSFLTVILFAYLGAYIHWRMMKRDKRVQGTFWDYLVADYPGKSITTGVAILGSGWISVTSGASALINPAVLWVALSNGTIPIQSINGIVSAVAIGYMLDSGLNKGGS